MKDIRKRVLDFINMETNNPSFDMEYGALRDRLLIMKTSNPEHLKEICSLLSTIQNKKFKTSNMDVYKTLQAFKSVYFEESVNSAIFSRVSVEQVIEARTYCNQFLDFSNKTYDSGWYDKYNNYTVSIANKLAEKLYKDYKEAKNYWDSYEEFRSYCLTTCIRELLDMSKVSNSHKIIKTFDSIKSKELANSRELRKSDIFGEDTGSKVSKDKMLADLSRARMVNKAECEKVYREYLGKIYEFYENKEISEKGFERLKGYLQSNYKYFTFVPMCEDYMPIVTLWNISKKEDKSYMMTIYRKEEIEKAFYFADKFITLLTEQDIINEVILQVNMKLKIIKEEHPIVLDNCKKESKQRIEMLLKSKIITLKQSRDYMIKIDNF